MNTGKALKGLMSENNEIQLAINNETYIFQAKLLFLFRYKEARNL
jgi:hypothetical protein